MRDDNVIRPAKTGRQQNFPAPHTASSSLSLLLSLLNLSLGLPTTSIDTMSASNDVYQTPLNSRYASKSSPLLTNEGPRDPGLVKAGINQFTLYRLGDEIPVLASHAILDMAQPVDLARRVSERYEIERLREDHKDIVKFDVERNIQLTGSCL